MSVPRYKNSLDIPKVKQFKGESLLITKQLTNHKKENLIQDRTTTTDIWTPYYSSWQG